MSKSLKKLIDINRLREFKNKLVGAGSAYVQTAAVDQTIAGTKTFSKPIVGSVTGSSGSCTGNAATATKATQDSAGQQINTTYIKGLAVSGRTITYTKGDGSTGTITTQDTNTWTAFKGATSSANGTAGYVPAPTKGNQNKFFKADGTWATPPNTTYASMSASEATTGTATAARTISAKVLHDKINSNLSAYSKNGHTHDDRYYTETEVNNLLNGKANNNAVVHKSGNESIAGTKTFTANVHANGFHSTASNAFMAQCGEYTLVLRNDGDNTYILMSDKGGVPGTWSNARPLAISNSTGVCNINGNAATATNAGYANWLRTSSHSDHLFHTEWDNAGYFWTYVTDPAGSYVAVRVARSDSSGNADTATKLATARTIALSDAVTGTATAFDGSGNITIPVTALSPSAIRAQWYAAYPDGPEAHNAMWGGRNITAAFNNGTVSANIANGTFKDIFPGDYITKQVTIPQVLADDGTTVIFAGGTYTVNWVITDCDYWINKGDTAVTAHHVAIVPQTSIFATRMNPTSTTEGGYAGSDMYKKIIPACSTGIVNAFGSSHILTFRDHLTLDLNPSAVSSGITVLTGAPNWNGAWYSLQCNLMSEAMVYGGPHCASSALDNIMATRQMSAFRLSENLINYNTNWCWLRDVVSSSLFAMVGGGGHATTLPASIVYGVRPFALLV